MEWEYWEEKFKGMSEEEIEKYWEKEREIAYDDSAYEIDVADGMEPGFRKDMFNKDYENYKKAKAQHDAIIAESEKASFDGINREIEAIKEEREEKSIDDNSRD